jgi:hypothetical protein
MEIILVLKMFLTGVLEFSRFFKKSHAVDGKFSRARWCKRLRNRKKAFPFYGGNISYFFSFSFDDNFDLTNAKISNAELDEQLKEIVRDFQKCNCGN